MKEKDILDSSGEVKWSFIGWWMLIGFLLGITILKILGMVVFV